MLKSDFEKYEQSQYETHFITFDNSGPINEEKLGEICEIIVAMLEEKVMYNDEEKEKEEREKEVRRIKADAGH